MLAEVVGLDDIADVEGFVHARINAARLVLSPEEREELVAEGLAILFRLHRDYRPHIEGHGDNGRFSGYAAQFLSRRLGDAWHRMHPEHHLRCQPDGRRRWEYGQRAVSLDHAQHDEETGRELRPLSDALVQQPGETDLRYRLRVALEERWARRRAFILDVGELLGLGSTPQEVAHETGTTLEMVRSAMDEIGYVADRIKEAA